jgi:hypothetical protein
VCNEPDSFNSAVKSEHARQWESAMKSEYDSIMRNETWILTELPPGRKPIGYKLKHNQDGNVSRYKAPLVAKGFHQTHGVGYDAPCICSSICCSCKVHDCPYCVRYISLELHQMEGFVQTGQEHSVNLQTSKVIIRLKASFNILI